MKEFINKLTSSLDIHSKGFSARKLTSLSVMLCVIAAHIKWLSIGDFSLMAEILVIDYTFIAALFGMTTYSGIKTKKDEANTENNV